MAVGSKFGESVSSGSDVGTVPGLDEQPLADGPRIFVARTPPARN
jgi:hypothetical protein